MTDGMTQWDRNAALKAVVAPFRSAAEAADPVGLWTALEQVFAHDAVARMCHPFGELTGGAGLHEAAYAPLMHAVPDLERRDMIVVAGRTPEGSDWVGTMGNYMGRFLQPFLGIPATGRLVHMRYHEFFRIEQNRVVEMQAIWDLPELMMQAGAWPLAPQLGAFIATPGPMTSDGLSVRGDGSEAMARVVDMLTDLCRHPSEPDPAVMRLDYHWHPRMTWYGPAGIGAARGIAEFRAHHQIPFLRAFPDRKLDAMGDLMSHWIAEGDFVAETGWPNMRLTHSGSGWLGLPATEREILMRSLDFWRVEPGGIRENWVLVDILDVLDQMGLDVFARMRERL